MDFKFTRKELIVIGVVAAIPVVALIVSFSVGKLMLSIERAKYQKAGIPTSIKEYNAKYYKAIPDRENALETMEKAFSFLSEKNHYIYPYRPVLDQKIEPQLYALHQKILVDNPDFYDAIKKINKFSKIRYKCNYKNIEWESSNCNFFDSSDYFIAKIEYAISKKDSKLATEVLKLAFLLNEFSSQKPYTAYYNDYLNYYGERILGKFVRCLSILNFSESDLKDFIKIFNEHEKLIKKYSEKIIFNLL